MVEKIGLLASSSMCADALEGRWITCAYLDLCLDFSRTCLRFGWASWQIREVATAVCMPLLTWNQICK